MWLFTVSEKFALTGKLIITTYRPYIHKSLDRQSSRTHGRTKVDIREFKQIATAGADTAAGSKFPQK